MCYAHMYSANGYDWSNRSDRGHLRDDSVEKPRRKPRIGVRKEVCICMLGGGPPTH